MKKSTKGAFAAGAAAVLLLGGAGSLAYWTSGQSIAGGTITAGNLSIATPNCGSGWTYDAKEDAPGATFTPGTSLLVPGDVITETCTTVLTATGDHMRGTITATPGTTDISPFVLGISSITDGGTALAGGAFTEANNGHTLSVTVTVTFPDTGAPASDTTGDNQYKNVQKTLDAITLAAKQIHA